MARVQSVGAPYSAETRSVAAPGTSCPLITTRVGRVVGVHFAVFGARGRGWCSFLFYSDLGGGVGVSGKGLGGWGLMEGRGGGYLLFNCSLRWARVGVSDGVRG